MFKTVLAIYQLDLGVYPTSKQGLKALRVLPGDLPNPVKWNGPYLRKDVPMDPWSNRYHYELLAPDRFRIYSAGPDGKPGTPDDVVGGSE